MASRWMQQKKLKQRRMRRAWAKSFSMRNTGPTKDPIVASVAPKARSQAAIFWLKDALLKKFKFNPNSNEAIYVRTRGLHTDLSPDSKELVLAKMMHSKSHAGSLQGEGTIFVTHVCHSRPTSHLVLYMGGAENFFIEVRVTDKGPYVFKSILYPDRHNAMKALVNGIIWEDFDSLLEANEHS
jgi:hypothetical protein